MISYTMVGTADLDRAVAFYDRLFQAMGLEQCWRDETSVAWGDRDAPDAPRFFACRPFDGQPARPGNGTMTAFAATGPEMVGRLHALALELGGTDEGGPGTRAAYGPTFYVAYARDPDGNKIAFCCTLTE